MFDNDANVFCQERVVRKVESAIHRIVIIFCCVDKTDNHLGWAILAFLN